MKGTSKGDFWLSPQPFDSHNPFLEACATFVHRHLKCVEFFRQERTGESGFQATVGETVEHGKLCSHFDGMIKCRQHGSCHQPYMSSALSDGGKKDNRTRRVAAIATKVMLDRTDVVIAQCIRSDGKG